MYKFKFLLFFAAGCFASSVCNGCGSDSRPAACKSDDECAPHEACIDDVCTEIECKTDMDCPGDERCVDFKCVSDAECSVDRDCESGKICDGGKCVSGCRSDRDCPPGRICLPDEGENGLCVECQIDGDCEQGEKCIDHACIERCDSDTDCPSGHCDLSSHECAECTLDSHCEIGFICESNACVSGCHHDDDCDPGYICENNTCREGCRQDAECISGKCIQETNTCAECTDDGDCLDSDFPRCENYVCVPECTSDGDCHTPGEVCIDNHCIQPVHGNLAWAKKIGSLNDVECRSAAALDGDSLILVGGFQATATFGAGESAETSLTAAGIADVFLARYNEDGTVAWAKRAGSSGDNGNETAYDVTLLSGGSFIAAGMYEGTAVFGPGESCETSLSAPSAAEEAFIAKFNNDGTVAWAKSAGGADGDRAKAIEALADGSFLLTGYFSSSATWGAGESSESILDAAGMTDVFLARYNPDGTIAWVKRAGGVGSDQGLDLATASDGTTILVGTFEETAVFGLGEIAETSLEAAGGTDGFFAKYNPDGTIAWAKKIGGGEQDSVRGVSLLADGSFLVAGHLSGTVVFGMGEPNETQSDGTWNVFLAKYDGDGLLQWAKGVSKDGTGKVEVGDISKLPDGSFRITGGFGGTGSIIFGMGEINEASVSTGNEYLHAYVAGYGPDGIFKWIKTAGGNDSRGTCGLDLTLLQDDSVVAIGFFGGTAIFGNGEDCESELTSDGEVDAFIIKLVP
ncbi:MAG: hypothetical protein JRJ87_08780 [Deltaproteobacteria bacterium]|nr:hypothetical protein [Deltaproteobacteria bacterium]